MKDTHTEAGFLLHEGELSHRLEDLRQNASAWPLVQTVEEKGFRFLPRCLSRPAVGFC